MSIIELQDVSLDYVIKSGYTSLKKTFVHFGKTMFSKNSNESTSVYHSSFRALNQVNLNFNKGDRVGLIGRNGAGKSSLLKILAKIYNPNQGIVNVNGSITGLFDICLGIDAEATGYENIIHLGIMRGLSKNQSRNLISDVESFTELGDFLNAPVRTYSSGMQMKLAFAVATANAPEIILIDEIIGVGDSYFMEKAAKRISNLIESSHILVLTSHSFETIRRFCNKVVVLERGEVKFFGDTEDGINFYSKELN